MIKDRAPAASKPVSAGGVAPIKQVRPKFMAHVVLNSRNVPALVEWWCKVLKAHSMDEDYPTAAGTDPSTKHKLDFITFDEEHHRLAFVNTDLMMGNGPTPGPGKGIPTSLHHIAFTFASIGDLVSHWKYLKSEGILPVYTLHHGPTVSAYYADPEGNRAELQVDAFDRREDLDAWFGTGAFSKHLGRGPTFDFQKLADRYDAGDDEAWLKSNEGFITQYADDFDARLSKK